MDPMYSQGLSNASMSPDHAELGVPNEILRVAHRLVSVLEHSGRTILITSMNEGEGKTRIAQHLALACGTLLDQRVLICDLHSKQAEAGIPSGADHLSAEDPIVGVPEHMYGMSGEFSQELQSAFSIEPTSQPLIKRLVLNMNRGNLYRFLKNQLPFYRQEYRLSFVEAPGIYSPYKPDTVVLSPLFDQVILVIQPHKTPAEKVQDALSLLRNNGVRDIKLLINRGGTHGSHDALSVQLLRSPWINMLLNIPLIRSLGSWLQSRPRKNRSASLADSLPNPTVNVPPDPSAIQVHPVQMEQSPYGANHWEQDPRRRRR